MISYSENLTNSNSGSNCFRGFDPFWEDFGGFSGDLRSGPLSFSQSLVLDSERSEIVKGQVRGGKRSGISEEKAMAALKNHSEAERRRRERINVHLNTLRGLVPCTEKMDKAALLAEVITHVKQLKKTATESSKGLTIPMDDDEVRVEPHNEGDGTFSLAASLCCDYSPELMSELRQALKTLHLNIVKTEISTLGGRVKNFFVFTSKEDTNADNAEACQVLVNSVHQAFTTILDKVSVAADYALLNKRRKISFIDSSNSSS
ncbi:Transcription factor bHLH30 like [Actinidia chinensis var. chinensis]|uniref:Transcription factor bHLH30 like n=1 Tax=Actinidia chinensis var. chinensis TaxID=1590841 RepID=A0A2R6RGB3_ACTCC|nr:Transcription factor bHLH30 like [Actinidia chinensis var. chinensis]